MDRLVILADESGNPTGTAGVMEAHTGEGKLHIAFSDYVFDEGMQQILLQQRSRFKMLWPLIWANTCCSHPFPDEPAINAGQRRLMEEMGVSTPLTAGPSFVYRAEDPNGKGVEYEYVTILTGKMDPSVIVNPDPKEVAAHKWMEVTDVLEDFEANPDIYAPWFKTGLKLILNHQK